MESASLEQQVIDARQQRLSPLDAELLAFVETIGSFVVVYSGFPKYRHAAQETFAFTASNDPKDTTPATPYQLARTSWKSNQTTYTFAPVESEAPDLTISQADGKKAPIFVNGEPTKRVKFKRHKELTKWDKKQQRTTPSDSYPIYKPMRTGAVTVLLSTLLNSEGYVRKHSSQPE